MHPDIPSYPFEYVVADFFSLEGKNYLALADRYSNWLSVLQLEKDDSAHLIQAYREYFTYFGIPRQISSDGASIFTSKEMEEFSRRWGIIQRLSASYYPHSNKRAEVAVKSAKRLVRDNLQSDGSLHGDKFARALLIHRNSPDPSTGDSPAMIIYGRTLRDHLPTPLHKFAMKNDWEKAAKRREDCYMKRHYAKCEDLSSKAKSLPKLIPGDLVYVQDQTGKTPKQWNKSGKVLEELPHDSYLISIDGSFQTTRRNRKFLRKFTPFNTANLPAPPAQDAQPSINQPAPVMDFSYNDSPLPDQHLRQSEQQEAGSREPGELEKDAGSPPQPQDARTQTKPIIPRHLRERWIIAPPSNTRKGPVREEWILAPPSSQPNDSDNQSEVNDNDISDQNTIENPQVDLNIDALHAGENQLRNIIKIIVQACLEVPQLNLSAASMKEGGLTRT